MQCGVRAIPLGIAALVLGFVLKSAGTQANPTDSGLPAPRISVFGTIHPDVFRLSAPLGSGSAADRIRLASVEPQVGFDALISGRSEPAATSASACESGPFAERFSALDNRPAAFEQRFTSGDDCQSSIDESLASAMRNLASNLRLPPDRGIDKKRADAASKPAVAKVRKALPPLEDDGRVAIYDITARTVYLPSGRRLEAHSGLGGLMDNPAHVDKPNVGPTPPGVYEMRPRERLFHGVAALRLTPAEGTDTLGRVGLLAHPYMLGPNGDSNGCVSIKDYDRFLAAYNNGEVKRLVVVPSLKEGLTASRRSPSPSLPPPLPAMPRLLPTRRCARPSRSASTARRCRSARSARPTASSPISARSSGSNSGLCTPMP